MAKIELHAHYNGEHIVLDEPFDLPVDAPLLVTMLPPAADPESEEAWLRAATTSDAFAFLAAPSEDIYTLTDGEPFEDAA